MIAFTVIAFPTNQHAIDHALGSGTALTRPENWMFILPVYYIFAKAKGWTNDTTTRQAISENISRLEIQGCGDS